VYWCRDPHDLWVAVDPKPVRGGILVINDEMTAILMVRTWPDAEKARRAGVLDFVPHAQVCPARRT
jgi:hypothetical protein